MTKRRRANQGEALDERAALFARLEQIVQGLVATFAPFCAVILHDLTNPQGAIRASTTTCPAARPATRRRNSAAPTSLTRTIHKSSPTTPTPFADGRRANSTSIGIKDAKGAYVAALCLNVDLTLFQALQSCIGKFTSVDKQNCVNESLNPA